MTTAVTDTHLERGLAFLSQLRLPDGMPMGERFATDDWLRDRVFAPSLAQREDGRPEHRLVWAELTKGSLKSTALGALGLTEGLLVPRTHTFLIATDEDQAKLPLEAVSSMIDQDRRLQHVVRRTGTLFSFPNGSLVKVMSSDEKSFHGIGPAAARLKVYADELTQWPSRALYDAAQATLPKSPDGGQLVVSTNAGIALSWQEEAKAQLRAAGAYMYTAPQGWLPSWQDRRGILALRETMLLPLWERYYLNKWVQGVDHFIDLSLWDACRVDVLPPPREKEWHILAVDAGITGDCFAVVSVTRDPERPADSVVIRDVACWTPPRGGRIDFALPWQWLVDYVRSHDRCMVVYDPYQLEDFAQRLSVEADVWVAAFDQGHRRLVADSLFYQLVSQGRIKHDGNELLRAHVGNAALKLSVQEDTKGRIVKKAQDKKVDLCVAASMAAHQCMHLLLE